MDVKIQTIPEIKAGIKNSFTSIIDLVTETDDEIFNQILIPQKWSIFEQLDHMLRSVKPLNQGLLLPKFVIGLLFGSMKRPEKSYEEIINKYHGRLSEGYKATGRYVPDNQQKQKKIFMLNDYANQREKLISRLNSWNEETISTYLLPHPVLGKLTVREMMFFTIYHNFHHLEQIKTLITHAK